MSTDRAVVAAVAAEIGATEDEVQFSLLDQPETIGGGNRIAHVVPRPGRPLGARNKRTERTVRWLLSRHRDPREALLAVTDMHPADLAHLLGCKLLEAVQEQRLCAQAVLPYVAQRMPLAIDVRNRSVVYLTINEGGQAARGAEGVGLAASILDLQPLSEDAPGDVGQGEVGQGSQDADPQG